MIVLFLADVINQDNRNAVHELKLSRRRLTQDNEHMGKERMRTCQ